MLQMQCVYSTGAAAHVENSAPLILSARSFFWPTFGLPAVASCSNARFPSLNVCPTAMTDAIKCEHERSIHLFIDSLLNEQEAGQAYSCGSSDMFDRGICLSCKNSRCNTVGYDVSRVRKARSLKMFTKTRASMPFRGRLTGRFRSSSKCR